MCCLLLGVVVPQDVAESLCEHTAVGGGAGCAGACMDVSFGCVMVAGACRKAVVDVVGQLHPLDVREVSPEVDSVPHMQPLEVALDALQVVGRECGGLQREQEQADIRRLRSRCKVRGVHGE